MGDEAEREEVKDQGFLIQPGFMVMEVELINGGFIT
jgi:hypothetical protein